MIFDQQGACSCSNVELHGRPHNGNVRDFLPKRCWSFFDKEIMLYEIKHKALLIKNPCNAVVVKLAPNIFSITCTCCHSRVIIYIQNLTAFVQKKNSSTKSLMRRFSQPAGVSSFVNINDRVPQVLKPFIQPNPVRELKENGYNELQDEFMPLEELEDLDFNLMFSGKGNAVVGSFHMEWE